MEVDETKTIIMEYQDNLLVRVDSSVVLGSKDYKLVSYEIWTDCEKYKEGIHEEWKEDGQHLYCLNHATTDEEDMIQTFKRRFKIMN
jgi:hypothetical protein